ncbi:hypothetical protein FA13DRAFT_1778418 [Coprinellus micaceus]|uniref:Nephrocystin 3-like N-terminal domain-containing protein n=1 Tax=Coprinellus micaceus TaxID=71717 RepID=A0A4Y7SN29_COPMI|nr:hypothetical protein FA13DRAFT_1778418 [Coprinellus micaceus]
MLLSCTPSPQQLPVSHSSLSLLGASLRCFPFFEDAHARKLHGPRIGVCSSGGKNQRTRGVAPGEGEAGPSIPSTSNRPSRNATKTHTTSTRELQPRHRSVENLSRPDRGSSRSPAPRAASASRARGNPYPSPRNARLGKASSRAEPEPVATDGCDVRAVDSERHASSIPRLTFDVEPSPVASSSRYVSIGDLNTSSGPPKSLFDYLDPHIAHGAAHDSDERWNAPSCHEETRVAIREDIISWIQHGEGDAEPKRIMWLSGPAGCGKTAIAGSVAETCKEQGLLAATFFFSSFSGSAERSSKGGFIATLAYHMSKNKALHQFKYQLHQTVDRHPDIFRKNLNEQVKCLILEPFRKVHDDQERREGWPRVVIIDGLDEVVAAQNHDPAEWQSSGTSEDDQVEILHVLTTLSKDPFFPFRIFVASRPERNISHFFSTKAPGTTVNLFLDSKYNPDADVKRFLVSRFAHIRRRAGISAPLWPGQAALDRLVEMSSGQFIVPTTIIRWVEAGVPQLQPDEVLQLAQPNSRTKNPFATLDSLYRHILQRARAHSPDDDPHLVVNWIVCITSAVFVPSTGRPPHANFWRQFLENVEGELNYRLGPMSNQSKDKFARQELDLLEIRMEFLDIGERPPKGAEFVVLFSLGEESGLDQVQMERKIEEVGVGHAG